MPYYMYIISVSSVRCHVGDETFTRQFNLDRHMLRASHTSFASSLATLEDTPREVCNVGSLTPQDLYFEGGQGEKFTLPVRSC